MTDRIMSRLGVIVTVTGSAVFVVAVGLLPQTLTFANDDPPKTARYYRQQAAAAYKAKDYPGVNQNGMVEALQRVQNPTHGSGWIFQVQATRGGPEEVAESHPRKWVDRSSPGYTRRPEGSRIFTQPLPAWGLPER